MVVGRLREPSFAQCQQPGKCSCILTVNEACVFVYMCFKNVWWFLLQKEKASKNQPIFKYFSNQSPILQLFRTKVLYLRSNWFPTCTTLTDLFKKPVPTDCWERVYIMLLTKVFACEAKTQSIRVRCTWTNERARRILPASLVDRERAAWAKDYLEQSWSAPCKPVYRPRCY